VKKNLYLTIICLFFVPTSIMFSSCTTAERVNNTSQLITTEEVNDANNRESTRVISQPGDKIVTISGLFPKFTTDFLIKESHAIIIGEVIDILSSIRVDDPYRTGEKMIYTNVIIQIDRYLSGKSQDKQIALWVRGGRVGDNVVMVPDDPVYTVGDKVLLFLRSNDPYYPPPDKFGTANYYYGFAGEQGKYKYEGNNAISWDNKSLNVSELEQDIAKLKEAQ